MKLHFVLDGEEVTIETPPERPLVDVLRDDLGLEQVGVGCRQGCCGACHVLVDGELSASCLWPAFRIQGRRVSTAAGLHKDKLFADMAEAVGGVIERTAGRSGLLVSLYALLGQIERMDREEFLAAVCGNAAAVADWAELHRRLRRFAAARGRRWQTRRGESTSRALGT